MQSNSTQSTQNNSTQSMQNNSTESMQNNSIHTMVDARSLTINTALEVCQTYPQDWHCDICKCSLKPTSEDATDPTGTEVVITKVCGDKHHFHRACIEAWFRSGTPHLNECPLDRKILYGTERVPQAPVNLPGYTEFPGHDVEGHEEFYSSHQDFNEQDLPDVFYSGGPDEWIDEAAGLVSFFGPAESVEIDDIADMPPPTAEEQIAIEAAFGPDQAELAQDFRYFLSSVAPIISFLDMFPGNPADHVSRRRQERIFVLATYGYEYPERREQFPVLLNAMEPMSHAERGWLTHMGPAEPEEPVPLFPFRTLTDSDEVLDELDDDHPDVRRWRA
jgi:hypothetical protein